MKSAVIGRDLVASPDVEAIEMVVTTLIAGWNTHDVELFASVFSDDAEFVPWFGALFTGRSGVISAHRHAFETVHKESVKTVVENRIRVLAPGVASVRCESTLTGVRDRFGALEPEMHERWMMAVQLVDGQWKIVEAQNTFVVAWEGAPQ